jgi:hypothetical protein
MSEIKVGCGVSAPVWVKTELWKFHPYGLGEFRENVKSFIEEKREKGLAYQGYDNLTHAWRTPWDVHIRYTELFGTLNELVLGVCQSLTDDNPPVELWSAEMWAAEYTDVSGASKHHHGLFNFGYSWCYYVEVPDDGPGLMVYNDNDPTPMNMNVTAGDLVIFKNPVEHQVLPSVDRRIIVSGNIYKPQAVPEVIFSLYNNRDSLSKILSHQYDEYKTPNPDDWSKSTIEQVTGIPYAN